MISRLHSWALYHEVICQPSPCLSTSTCKTTTLPRAFLCYNILWPCDYVFSNLYTLNNQTINSLFLGNMMKVQPDVHGPVPALMGKTALWCTQNLAGVAWERHSSMWPWRAMKPELHRSWSSPDRRACLECNVLAICRRMFIAALQRPNTRLRKSTSEHRMVAAAQFCHLFAVSIHLWA